jgi:predicted glycoside hydrolase/deacetylase ChbG (UPF0249 family)
MGSTAERLGFERDERVAVVHVDDIGMCEAQSDGGFEALENGPATCGSVMVPCPGFAAAAERARAQPELDLGVHLTLTAEWPEFRWGPVLGAEAVPSLVDAEGFFPRSAAEVVQRARPEEAEAELRAQVARALDAGIDVTHLDAHMGTAFFPPFVASYGRLMREHRVPSFLVRPAPAALAHLGAEASEIYEEVIGGLEGDGWPLLDAFDADSLGFAPGTGAEHNRTRLEKLTVGVTYLICHPARGGAELDAIVNDGHAREFERTYYGGAPGHRALAEHGIRTIGMRSLRDLIRIAH